MASLLEALRRIREVRLTSDALEVELARILEEELEADGPDDARPEILRGAVSDRLALARATRAAETTARQLDVLHAVTRGGEDLLRVPEAADRALRFVHETFQCVHAGLHVAVGPNLELVARHVDGEPARVDQAPPWLRSIRPGDRLLPLLATRARQTLSRPIASLSARARELLGPLGVQHMVAAPLFDGDRVMGSLTVTYREVEPWSEEKLARFEHAAAQVAAAIAPIRRLEEARQRAYDLERIAALGTRVSEELELGAVLQRTVTELAALTDVPIAQLFLATDGALKTAASSSELFVDVELPADTSSVAGIAFVTRAALWVEDVQTDERVSRALAERMQMRSIMAVPLIARGEPIGVIALVETREIRHFSPAEIARATTVANLIAPVILNAKIFDDLRRSHEALARAQAELVSRERQVALGELSAVVAHEVRNPIAIIFNSLTSLRKQDLASGDARVLLDIVGEEARRLDRIVSDLLDFVRPYVPSPRPVRLEQVLESAVAGAVRAQPDDVQIAVEIGSAPETVIVDGTMLQQALQNLIVNALQVTPKGGTVTVRAKVTSRARTLRCEVQDSGPGLPAAARERMFQPFYTTKATGTGLGLAIVKRVVEALGGEVKVSSPARKGATFSLILPLGDPR